MHRRNTRGYLAQQSFIKLFSQSLFSIWGSPSSPVDLAPLNNFEDKKCIISITNYINVPITHVEQPILTRKPVPAIFKFEWNVLAPIIKWTLENRIVHSGKPNSSWFREESQSEYCIHFGQCATFDMNKLIIKSKLWNCQLRVDLFPPILEPSLLNSAFNDLSVIYKNLQSRALTFLPLLWEIELTQRRSALAAILVGRTSVIQIFIFTLKSIYCSFSINELVPAWTVETEYTKIFLSTNVEFFLVDLTEHISQLYSLGSVKYINRYHQNGITDLQLKNLEPGEMFQHLRHQWNSQMNWEIDVSVEALRMHFEMCGNKIQRNHGKSRGTVAAEEILYQALVRVWQSVLKNYTYTVVHTNIGTCLTDRVISFNLEATSSRIVIDDIYLRRFLHIPMQIVNPVNGSFRFVVCGVRGSELMAFAELINVYDKYIWGLLVVLVCISAFIWNCLLPAPSAGEWKIKILSGAIGWIAAFGKLYALGKVLLEQGELSSGSASISNQKVRLFLAIILMMSIILSNGYKNANVYKMVTHRELLRYERFDGTIGYTCFPIVVGRQIFLLFRSLIRETAACSESTTAIFSQFPKESDKRLSSVC